MPSGSTGPAVTAPPPAEALPGSRTTPALVGLPVLVVAAAAGFAWDPWLTFGILLGSVLFGLSVHWPLGVVAAMLAIGPLDLSFLTGGFKTMFEQLGGLDMNGIRLIFVSAGLGLVVLGDRGYWGEFRSPAVWLWALFLAYGFATLAFSADPLEGARLIMKLAWPLLIYLLAVRASPTDLDRLVDWTLVGAAVLVVINPVFTALGDVYVEADGQLRLMGAGTHQNPFSFAMLVVMLVSLVRFTFRRQPRYLLLAAGAGSWMVLTQTRITFLAGLVSLGVIALYSAVVRRNFRAAGWGLLAAVALGVVLAPFVLERTFGTVPSLPELRALLSDPVALYGAINWSGREILWAVLVLAWMTSPWIGLGMGSSSAVLAALVPTELGSVAHNEYIRLGTDTGVLGVGLFALAALTWLLAAARSGLGADSKTQEFVLPAIAIMVAWAVISVTDNAFDYYAPFTQFAGFFVGASVALHRRSAARAS